MRICVNVAFIVKSPRSPTQAAKRSTRDQQESRIQEQTSTKPASVIYFAISKVAMKIGGAIFCSICCRYFSGIKKSDRRKCGRHFRQRVFGPTLTVPGVTNNTNLQFLALLKNIKIGNKHRQTDRQTDRQSLHLP